METKFLPIYNSVFFRRKLLFEKYFKYNEDEIWDNHFILEFKPFSESPSNFLIQSPSSKFPVDLIHWNTEYCSFPVNLIDNIGKTDGSDFINWIYSFYNKENKYYKFNIYDENAANINIYVITKNMNKVAKFQLMSCVLKEPIFYSFNKINYNYPQLSINLCTKNQVSINHLAKRDN